MIHSIRVFASCALLTLAACAGDVSETSNADTAPTDIPADQQIRTADPFARGYSESDFPRVKELAPGVYSYEQLRSAGEEMFTTVSMFVVTDDGVLVADGQGSVEETARLVEYIGQLTDQPITTVVVASDHGDHTAGNSAFPEGVDFIAHPTSAAALEAMAANRRGDTPPVPLATRTVDDEILIDMGGRQIHVLFLGRAHTGGDLVVYLPEEKIMFMSEAYLHRIFPAMRSAFPSEWVAMIEAAQAMDVDMYVPGHGFVDDPSILEDELEIFQGAIRSVIAQARLLHEEGYGVEDAQQQAFFGDLEEWTLRESQGDRAIQQVYAELDGELPEPGR
ncbi:MAG: MBL fold metallo-hydrolase [Gemmatimonadota bacterium]|nr:MBL fold metallo-hydrolase [Gemmatimonadota bacterium]MDH3424652.1 MBL fold metallo-hydrolase [Gemmatimonadota bacterium]